MLFQPFLFFQYTFTNCPSLSCHSRLHSSQYAIDNTPLFLGKTNNLMGYNAYKKQRSVVNRVRVLTWMKPTMARERRALGKSILEKKKWLKEQLSGLFITKSLNLQAEERTFKPRVKIIIFMHLSTVTVWEGEPNTAWSMGEKYGNGKKYHFSFPH